MVFFVLLCLRRFLFLCLCTFSLLFVSLLSPLSLTYPPGLVMRYPRTFPLSFYISSVFISLDDLERGGLNRSFLWFLKYPPWLLIATSTWLDSTLFYLLCFFLLLSSLDFDFFVFWFSYFYAYRGHEVYERTERFFDFCWTIMFVCFFSYPFFFFMTAFDFWEIMKYEHLLLCLPLPTPFFFLYLCFEWPHFLSS